MGHENNLTAFGINIVQGTQCSINPVGIKYLSLLYDIVINPHKNDFTLQVRVLKSRQIDDVHCAIPFR